MPKHLRLRHRQRMRRRRSRLTHQPVRLWQRLQRLRTARTAAQLNALIETAAAQRRTIDVQQHDIAIAIREAEAEHFRHELADLARREIHHRRDLPAGGNAATLTVSAPPASNVARIAAGTLDIGIVALPTR